MIRKKNTNLDIIAFWALKEFRRVATPFSSVEIFHKEKSFLVT